MIYCDLIEKTDTTATYSYSCGWGGRGKIIFLLGENQTQLYKIIEKPELSCSKLWIEKLCYKYHKDFLNGIAKDKIAYEC